MPSKRRQVRIRLAPELETRVEAFAKAYGYSWAHAVVTLTVLGLSEFDAIQERAKRQASGMYSNIPQVERTS